MEQMKNPAGPNRVGKWEISGNILWKFPEISQLIFNISQIWEILGNIRKDWEIFKNFELLQTVQLCIALFTETDNEVSHID